MPAILVRVLIAVLCVVLAFLLIPLFFSVIGVPIAANVLAIIKICIAGWAVWYVLTGSK